MSDIKESDILTAEQFTPINENAVVKRTKKDTQFKPGNPGKPKGTRNKLSNKFIEALYEKFEEKKDIIMQELYKDPVEYCKILAKLVPKQIEIGEMNQFSDMSDEDVKKYITSAQKELKVIS